MKTKLIILFLLLTPIVDVFYSCCDCPETKNYKYSHKALLLKNLDNSGKKVIESESLQLNKNAYGIRIYLTREKNLVARARQVNNVFVQSAYAFSCECLVPEFVYAPSDSITSIKIFTINDFDDRHSENSDITDYFRIAHSFSTIKDFVANERYTYKYGYRYHHSSEKPFEDELKIDLLLMTAPTMNNKQQFKIQVTLSDRRIFEEQTTEIQLL